MTATVQRCATSTAVWIGIFFAVQLAASFFTSSDVTLFLASAFAASVVNHLRARRRFPDRFPPLRKPKP
jgi:hypothetical protein